MNLGCRGLILGLIGNVAGVTKPLHLMDLEPTTIGPSSHVLVMLSGGIDSSASVHFYASRGRSLDTMFIDYGQPTANKERQSAAAISAHYGTWHREIQISGAVLKKPGIVRGRNALLLFCALNEWRYDSGLLVLGVHAGTRYPDCSEPFISAMQSIIDLYSGGRIVAAAPFLDWPKRAIWDYCHMHNVPVGLTYSCQTSALTPCGSCDSCLDRKVLDAL